RGARELFRAIAQAEPQVHERGVRLRQRAFAQRLQRRLDVVVVARRGSLRARLLRGRVAVALLVSVFVFVLAVVPFVFVSVLVDIGRRFVRLFEFSDGNLLRLGL